MTLMTNEELDEVARHLPRVKAWVAAVEKELLRELEAGVEFTNVRLEPKRANRKWIEGLDVVKLLRKFSRLDVVAPRVPLSPSQAEKVLGKGVMAKLSKIEPPVLVKESSGMKLAYTSDTEN